MKNITTMKTITPIKYAKAKPTIAGVIHRPIAIKNANE